TPRKDLIVKFKTTTEYRTEPREITVDGKTHTRPKRVAVQVPRLPSDWDQLATSGAVALVLTLTSIAVVWSTFSIGDLLGGGVGLAAAVLFDLAWVICLLLEWLARFDEDKRAFPKKMGWALLFITMGAIFWHGMGRDNVALAVVGAVVSMVAKALWMGIMRHINRDLSEDHREWVKAEMSEANAKMAIAQVRRQAARADVRASMELLAAERIRSQYAAIAPAPVAQASPVLDLPASPGRAEITLRRAVGAILTDANQYAIASDVEISEEATDAISAAYADGWSVREVYDAATQVRRHRRNILDDATTARGHDVTIRTETSGYPAEAVSAQASTPDAGQSVRPDIRSEPEPEHDKERVPDQRPASLAATVKALVAEGLTDAEHIARSLARRFDRQATDPTYVETVKRYVREAKNAEPNDGMDAAYL
ncbi:hypothetical protein ACFWDI_40860, partial [Streptomyces sp. NPDC060064]|uniref:hypothetical protein n=1 Tax=Streptomyces sp. NPDC060064 TaxID=3347049 RepID=UPI003687C805